MTFQLTFSKRVWWLDGTKWTFLDGWTGERKQHSSTLKTQHTVHSSTTRQGRQPGHVGLSEQPGES